MIPAILIVGLFGCSSRPENVGSVSGTIKLDGQPLANARVTFTPRGGQTNSFGTTDANGRYALVYSRHHDGAEIGEHTVSIATFVPADPDVEPPVVRVPERLPAEYNHHTNLTAKVAAGRNTIDFDLTTGGIVVQPDQIPESPD